MNPISRKNRLAQLIVRLVLNPLTGPLLLKLFKVMALTGYGTDKCLEQGFLPVPVHFYSTIPDIKDLEQRKIWDQKSLLTGIDFRAADQRQLMQQLKEFSSECQWPRDRILHSDKYFTDNTSYDFPDAALTYTIIRNVQPRKIIEIGSGQSTKILSQAIQKNQETYNFATEYYVVDPYPPAFVTNGSLPIQQVVQQRVELLDPAFFDQLNTGDVLFIDSSHMGKIGSDVNFLYLEVLPKLRPGISVHIHDISLPYEYAKTYALSQTFRQFWTEQYLLQALLVHNDHFQIELALHWVLHDHLDWFMDTFPQVTEKKYRITGGSFWMKSR